MAFSVRAVPVGEPWSTNFDIYTVAAGGGTPRNLTADNPAWDGKPAFSPDGSSLAYVAMDRPGFESDRFHLVLLQSAHRSQASAHPELGSIDRQPSPGRATARLLFATTDHLGQHPLWAIDAHTGRASAITGAGDVEGFSVGAQKVIYAQSNLANPADLYSVGFAGGKPLQLTHLNQPAARQPPVGRVRAIQFRRLRTTTMSSATS